MAHAIRAILLASAMAATLVVCRGPVTFAPRAHRHHLRGLPGHEAFDVRRPALQRRSLGQQLAFVVVASDAAAQPTGVVDCHLDHIGPDAEIGGPGDESPS